MHLTHRNGTEPSQFPASVFQTYIVPEGESSKLQITPPASHGLAVLGRHRMAGFGPKTKPAEGTVALSGMETSRVISGLTLNISIDSPGVPNGKLMCFTRFAVACGSVC